MTKCKRMLVAILILSMLSSNVAYAAGSGMGVNAMPVETIVEDSIVSMDEGIIDVVETTTQEETSTGLEITEEMVSTEEVDESETVPETTEVSGEDTIETTVETTEEAAVESTEEETTLVEESTEYETVTETVMEETTEMEMVSENALKTEQLQTTNTSIEDKLESFLDLQVYDSYEVYYDAYRVISVGYIMYVGRYPYTLNMEITEGYDNLEIIEKDTDLSDRDARAFYVIKGLEKGESSVTFTVTYEGVSLSKEVPITITDAPEDNADIEDGELFYLVWKQFCFFDSIVLWGPTLYYYVREDDIEKAKNATRFRIDCSVFEKIPEEFYTYLNNCTDLSVIYSDGKGPSFDYSLINKELITKLYIDSDPYMEVFELENYPNLENLTLLGNIGISASKEAEKIKSIQITENDTLKDFSVLGYVPNLEKFGIEQCSNLTEISEIKTGYGVKELKISKCNNLKDISGLKDIEGLEKIEISDCNNLTNISEIENVPCLKDITISYMDNLTELLLFAGVESLENIKVLYCDNLAAISAGDKKTYVKNIEISECNNLTELPIFAGIENLENIKVSSCDKLEKITADGSGSNVKNIDISYCEKLCDISGLSGLNKLEMVKFEFCLNLKDISTLKSCPKLTQANAINLEYIGATPEDVLDLMIFEDMDCSLGSRDNRIMTNVSYYDESIRYISDNSEIVIVNGSYLYTNGVGVTKIKASFDYSMSYYKEFSVYVDDNAGIRGGVGEPVAEDKLPEVYSATNAYIGAVVWDKVNNKVVDLEDGKEVVSNVTNYVGQWVYGVEEAGVKESCYGSKTVPFFYSGIALDTDGNVHSHVRYVVGDLNGNETEVKEDKIHSLLSSDKVSKIGSGCILTTDGALYCVTSENNLLKVDAGVTDFLDSSAGDGIYYLKGKKLYNSFNKNKAIRSDINGFVPGGCAFAVSDTKSYELGTFYDAEYYSGDGYNEITEPTSGVIVQAVMWGNGSNFFLYEDGTLYYDFIFSRKLDENVKSVDNLGYIKEEDGKEVRYTFTGVRLSEFSQYTEEDISNICVPFLLGKDGIYYNGYFNKFISFRLSDVVKMTETKYYELKKYAIRSDGTVWDPGQWSHNVPQKIYPIPTASDAPTYDATSIAFANEEIVVESKEMQQLSVTILPEGSNAGKITYSVDNPRIATVTSSGRLRPVKNGETTIHATSESGLTASCTVKVVLPIEMTGIALPEEELTMAEGDSKKLTVVYTPEDTTEDKSILWTSSDSTKVSVDEDGTLYALAGTMGTSVTITGVSMVHDNLKVTCKVSVNKVFTEEEIVVPQGITATTNVTKTLADIELPEGWTFKEPETELTEPGEKSFAAVYSKEYYVPAERDITVSINRITGVSVSGNGLFETKEKETYSLQFLTEGLGDIQDCYDIEWKIKDTKIASIDGSKNEETVTVEGKKVGTTKLTVSVTLKNTEGKTCETLQAETELKIRPADAVENVKIILGEDAISDGLAIGDEDTTIHIPYNQKSEMDDTVTFSKKYSFTIDAECYKKGKPVTGVAVKWTSSDKKVATIKTTKGVTTVTLVGDGTTILTAAVQDEGKSTAEVVLSVEDYTPRIENTTLTLNKALEDGVLFNMYPAYERTVADNIAVYEDVKGTLIESSVFEVTKDANETFGYRLNLKDGVDYASVKNKTYSKLYLRTDVTGEGIYDIPIKIKVVASIPSVTIKQNDKVNLFYTDDIGTYTISAKNAKIAGVEYISKASEESLPQLEGTWNGETGSLVVSQKNVTADNYKKIVNKGTIRILFEGYRTEAYGGKNAYEKAVTVSKEYKQPQWVLTASKVTRYAALSELVKVGIYDKTDKSKTLIPLVADEIRFDTGKLKNTYELEQITDNQMNIRITGAKSSESLPILIAKDNFREAKKLTLKVTLKGENTLPAYTVSAKSISLNKRYAQTETALLDLALKEDSNQRIEGVNVYYSNNCPYLYGDIEFIYLDESEQLQVKLQYEDVQSKHEFQIAPMVSTEDGGILELAKTKLKVTVVDKAPTIKLSAKGTINPIDRENTCVQITPKLGNIQGSVESVTITNDYKELFDANITEGKIVITAKDEKLIHNNKYKLNLTIGTQTGHIFEDVQCTVTPKQSSVKIKKSVDKITCFKPVKGIKYQVPLSFAITSPTNAKIEAIKLVSNSDYFVYDAEKEILYLSNADRLAVKSHKLTFEITCKGSCDNVKKTTVTVTVNLKK